MRSSCKALIRAAGGDDLQTTRLAPAAVAVCDKPAWAKDVNIRIFMLGSIVLKIFAASRPFSTGMEMSRIMASGLSCRAFSIPCCPFSASPHTSNSGMVSSRLRTIRLNTGWSSTINIRHGTQRPLIRLSIISSAASISTKPYYVEASACAAGPSFSPGSGRSR